MNVKLTVKLYHRHAGDRGFDFGDAVYHWQLFSNRIIQKLRLKIDTRCRLEISPSDRLQSAHSTRFETWIGDSLTTLYYFRCSVEAVSQVSSVSFTADRAQGLNLRAMEPIGTA